MSSQTDIDKLEPETEQVPLIWIILGLVSVLGLCALVIVGSLFALKAGVTSELDKRAHVIGTPALNKILDSEKKMLGEYKKLEEDKYQIPIDRAMELLVLEAKGASAAPVVDKEIEKEIEKADSTAAPDSTMKTAPATKTPVEASH